MEESWWHYIIGAAGAAFFASLFTAIGMFIRTALPPLSEAAKTRAEQARLDREAMALQAAAERKAVEDRQARFDKAQEERIASLVVQLDRKDAAVAALNDKLATLAASLASEQARNEALKAGLGVQIKEIAHTVNGGRDKLLVQIEQLRQDKDALAAKVQKLEAPSQTSPP